MTYESPFTKDWGKGWLTQNARDLVKLIYFVDSAVGHRLIMALIRTRSRSEKLSARTVYRVMDELNAK